jgi:hypothetical protein
MDVTIEGPAACRKFYVQWVKEVRDTVPAEKLLVFEAKQGWKPLCNFLGLPVPGKSYSLMWMRSYIFLAPISGRGKADFKGKSKKINYYCSFSR